MSGHPADANIYSRSKPICIAENKKANVIIVAKEYKRAADILAGYLHKITMDKFVTDTVAKIEITS